MSTDLTPLCALSGTKGLLAGGLPLGVSKMLVANSLALIPESYTSLFIKYLFGSF